MRIIARIVIVVLSLCGRIRRGEMDWEKELKRAFKFPFDGWLLYAVAFGIIWCLQLLLYIKIKCG